MRTFWIIWCCFWAAFWMLAGFFTFFLAWILVPFSLLAILLPIGSQNEIQVTYRPQFPSSREDTRFTIEERRNYFDGMG